MKIVCSWCERVIAGSTVGIVGGDEVALQSANHVVRRYPTKYRRHYFGIYSYRCSPIIEILKDSKLSRGNCPYNIGTNVA